MKQVNSIARPDIAPDDEVAFVARVEGELERTLGASGDVTRGTPPLLVTAARHLCLGEGKRARTRLVLACAGASSDALIDVATAAELMHAASLLHDDVLDEGFLRRGRATANAVWGNTVAVLAGDFLLGAAFARLAAHEPPLLRRAIEVVLEMTRAAMREVEARGRLDLDGSWWRSMALGKTGVLFGWCGAAGALVGGKPEASEACGRAATHLGIAFQLADDLVDLVPGVAGKTPFADIRNRAPSYPLLHAAAVDERARAALAEAWRGGAAIDPAVAAALGARVVAGGAVDATVRALDEELGQARAALGAVGHRLGAWIEALAHQVRALAATACSTPATKEDPCAAT